jgi:replicative DNA helicase
MNLESLETRNFENIIDLERVAIASILRSSRAKEGVLQKLSANHFLDSNLRKIFETAMLLYISDIEIDKNTVGSDLNKKQKVLLDTCLEMDFAESTLPHICDKIISEASIRDVHKLAEDIKLLTIDPSSTYEDVISTLHMKVLNVVTKHSEGKIITPAEFADGLIDSILNRKEGKVEGVTSSIKSLDNIVGFLPRALTLIAARPGFGKTQLALQCCVDNAIAGIPALFFSMEMPEEDLMLRVISRLARVNLHKLMTGSVSDDDLERVKKVVPVFRTLPLYLQSVGSLTLPDVKSKARTVSLQTKGKLGLVVVDYIQLMTGPGGTKNDMVSGIVSGLRQIALDMRIPVVGLSQLSRDCEKREDKRPVLSDLRDSGELEQSGHRIIFLYASYNYTHRLEEKNDLELIVAKNRNGPICSVKVYNEAQFQSIHDMEVSNGQA